MRLLGYPKSPSENLFLFGGELDQRFVLDRSTDLLRWEQATTNEITDSQGLLILLDNGTNALPVQFFRSRSQ